MNLICKSTMNRLGNTPIKSMFSLLVIALGVMIVAMVLNINFKLNRVKKSVSTNNVFNLANGSDKAGFIEYEYGGVIQIDIVDKLESEFKEITSITNVKHYVPGYLSYNDTYFEIGSAYGADNVYLDMFNIDIFNGRRFNRDNIKNEIIISNEVSDLIFKGESPIGKTINNVSEYRAEDGSLIKTIIALEVIGVYSAPTKILKDVQGIPDVIYSFNSVSGSRKEIELLKIEVKKNRIKGFRTKLEEFMNREYPGVNVSIWQGNSESGASNTTFKYAMFILPLVLSILGAICLFISSFGVTTMTMISVLERTRETGLKRALGSTKILIVRDFLLETVLTILSASVFGIILAAVLSPQFSYYVLKSNPSLDLHSSITLGLEPLPLFLSVALVTLSGIIFSIYPALQAGKSTPIDTIRES